MEPQVFDPNAGAMNAPEIDFAQKLADLKRQQQLAALLRKQVGEQPQGQMVSGRFVKPSILQHLAPLLQQYQAGQAEQAAGTQEAQLAQQTNAAQRDWQSSLPQATAAVRATDPPQDIGGNMIQGPEYEKTPASMPDRGQVLKAALRGMRIPGNEGATKMWADAMGKDLERHDTQTFRRETREDTQQARREQMEAEQRQQSAQQAERLHQAAELARQRSEDTRYGIDQRRESAREVAALMGQFKLAVANSKPGKPIPNSVHKELSGLEGSASAMSALASSFQPEYSGLLAAGKNAIAPYDPTGTCDTAGAEWWKDYAKNASLIERHALFGATLTSAEKKAWASADINSAMDDKIIKRNLDKRAELAAKVFGNAVNRYELGGYPNIREVFDAPVRVESDKPGRPQPATKPGQKKTVKWGELG